MDANVLAVSSSLVLQDSSYIVLSLVPSAAAACSRAAPGEPLELHDLEHCGDFDAALLRLDGSACTGLCAPAGSEGAVLAGFCGGPAAAAARASIMALADALAPNLHLAAAPLAANIKLLLLSPPAKAARPSGDAAAAAEQPPHAEAAAAEQQPHAEAEPDAPAESPVQGTGGGAAEAQRSEPGVAAASELAPHDPSACRREGEVGARRDSSDAAGAAPVLQDTGADPDADPDAGSSEHSVLARLRGRRCWGGGGGGEVEGMGATQQRGFDSPAGGGGARARDAHDGKEAGGAEGGGSAAAEGLRLAGGCRRRART